MELLKKCRDPDTPCIGVECKCDGLCVTALDVKVEEIIDGLPILAAWDDALILVKTMNDGKWADTKTVRAIIISLDRVCSMETDAAQVEPYAVSGRWVSSPGCADPATG